MRKCPTTDTTMICSLQHYFLIYFLSCLSCLYLSCLYEVMQYNDPETLNFYLQSQNFSCGRDVEYVTAVFLLTFVLQANISPPFLTKCIMYPTSSTFFVACHKLWSTRTFERKGLIILQRNSLNMYNAGKPQNNSSNCLDFREKRKVSQWECIFPKFLQAGKMDSARKKL